MHSLKAVTPLGASAPVVDEINGFTMREVVDRALVSVAARKGQDKAVAKILAKLIDAPTPQAGHFGGAMTKSKSAAIWMAPAQWMLDAPMKSRDDITTSLAAEFGGKASLTDQSDAWCRFEITGPQIDRLCSLLCAVDPRRLTAGCATRSSIEHIGAFLVRLGRTKLHVIGPRSSAASLHHAITTAMTSSVY
ncbi:MAG: sarcosine oxidase subunit gamma [Alphaproteobacteria bacterium]|nr:sarcosine oxidase subunit gamma [Alphaproteobacteria bacterium]